MELSPREKDKLMIFTAGLISGEKAESRLKTQLSGSHCLYFSYHSRSRSRREKCRRINELWNYPAQT